MENTDERIRSVYNEHKGDWLPLIQEIFDCIYYVKRNPYNLKYTEDEQVVVNNLKRWGKYNKRANGKLTIERLNGHMCRIVDANMKQPMKKSRRRNFVNTIIAKLICNDDLKLTKRTEIDGTGFYYDMVVR